jgi:hypothetical protein
MSNRNEKQQQHTKHVSCMCVCVCAEEKCLQDQYSHSLSVPKKRRP